MFSEIARTKVFKKKNYKYKKKSLNCLCCTFDKPIKRKILKIVSFAKDKMIYKYFALWYYSGKTTTPTTVCFPDGLSSMKPRDVAVELLKIDKDAPILNRIFQNQCAVEFDQFKFIDGVSCIGKTTMACKLSGLLLDYTEFNNGVFKSVNSSMSQSVKSSMSQSVKDYLYICWFMESLYIGRSHSTKGKEEIQVDRSPISNIIYDMVFDLYYKDTKMTYDDLMMMMPDLRKRVAFQCDILLDLMPTFNFGKISCFISHAFQKIWTQMRKRRSCLLDETASTSYIMIQMVIFSLFAKYLEFDIKVIVNPFENGEIFNANDEDSD